MKQLLFFFYILFLVGFVLYSYFFIDPGLFYFRFLFTDFFQTHRFIVTAIFILYIVLSFGFYLLFLYLFYTKRLLLKELFLLILASAGILLFAYPALVSFDIFNYIATAKVTFFYHENPYILMPIEFTHDPMLLFMHAANKTALYAPFWILLTGIPYLLGFGNFVITLFTFKLFVILFYVATFLLLWKATKDMVKTAFFALNPLVLFEICVSGHNDIVMMFFLLLGMVLFLKSQKALGIGFFILSIGIKYVTAILIPLFLLVFFKKISQKKLFLITTIFLYIIFFLSAFREEIYPWYVLWFLVPTTFLIGNNFVTWIGISFSFSLLLRYIPFMLLGTYFGPTPLLKFVLMVTPVLITSAIYFLIKLKKQSL